MYFLIMWKGCWKVMSVITNEKVFEELQGDMDHLSEQAHGGK